MIKKKVLVDIYHAAGVLHESKTLHMSSLENEYNMQKEALYSPGTQHGHHAIKVYISPYFVLLHSVFFPLNYMQLSSLFTQIFIKYIKLQKSWNGENRNK